MKSEINILINKIQRVPFSKIQEMLEDYSKEFEELSFIDQNAILNFIEKRYNIAQKLSKEEMMFNIFLFNDLSRRTKMDRQLKESTEKELKSLDVNLMCLIESLQYIESDTVEKVLRSYHQVLDSKVVETLIINLPENKQISAIKVCRDELMNSKPNTFHNFMASISKESQKFVLENFGEKFEKYSSKDMSDVSSYLYQDNIPVYVSKYQANIEQDVNLFYILDSCNEENLESILNQFKDQLEKLNADDLMKLLCFKTTNSKMLLNLWSNMPDKLAEVSIPYFKTFIRRLENKERFDAIYRLKSKFVEMKLDEIVELFQYDTDEVKAKVLIEYRDRFTGETSPELNSFMTKLVKQTMLDIYAEKQIEEFREKKEAGVNLKEEFVSIVSNLKDDKRYRLFDDDYIRAIALTKMLLIEDKSIDDKNPSYIELRQKYMSHLFKNLRRDNTVDDSINNSMFYRIVKGSVSFKQIDNLETVKALIYLSRNPQTKDVVQVEDLVSGLSEKQVQNYNIKLYKKLCERIKETYKDSSPLEENIQKLAFKMFFGFGYDKAIRILEHKKPFTSLEYLFNDLRVRNNELNEDGTPKLNEKFINYLFGSNRNDKNTNINKLLSDEIYNFDKYFSSIYNDWNTIYKKLNGSVSTKRILDLYKNQVVFLKPDEYKLAEPLQEIGTSDPVIIQKAKNWYQIMRERQYSSIPKVKGNIDNYEYEMLDLDDPLALAVGYITRCCFLINGLSRESLYHSISSKNGRTFVVRKDGELIAQSWVWRNGNILCFDNVEARGNYSYDTLLEIYQKASEELLDISNQIENEIESLKVITYGTSESRMSKPEKTFEGELPRVLENVRYSDAKYEQCVLAERKYKSLYYGNVAVRYEDPRPQIKEYNDILNMSDEEISGLNRELDAIEYSKTGKSRETNVRKCRYVICSKDWYIAIENDGKVTTQILNKDNRAAEECKAKAKLVIKEIKEDKIVVSTNFGDVGGEGR
jgi:hypothetical protein